MKKSKDEEAKTVPLIELGKSITPDNIHELVKRGSDSLGNPLEELRRLPPPDLDAEVDTEALAAVWGALDGHLARAEEANYGTGMSHFMHLCRLLADQDMRWVLENRPRAATKWLAHLMEVGLEPEPLDNQLADRDPPSCDADCDDSDDGDAGADGLGDLDRAPIRRQLYSGQMEALRTGRGAWYLSGRPRARASREAAMAACRLWAALETSLLRDFERQEIQPLFVEFRALCRDRHFQRVLEACPEAAAKWFHALTFQDDDESVDE